MIPPRRPGRDGDGSGVSSRVEACRRRLRTRRANGAPVSLEEAAADFVSDDSESDSVTSAKMDLGHITAEGQDEAGIP